MLKKKVIKLKKKSIELPQSKISGDGVDDLRKKMKSGWERA